MAKKNSNENKKEHECENPECSCNHEHQENHESKHHHQENHEPEHQHQENPQLTPQQEQERYLKLQMLDQQARQMDQQLQMLDQQMIELQMLKLNLEDLKKVNVKDEMLTPLGKNIFLKTSLLSKDLFVEIGAKTLAKKSIDDTTSIIDKDLTKLIDTRRKIMQEFTEVAREINTA